MAFLRKKLITIRYAGLIPACKYWLLWLKVKALARLSNPTERLVGILPPKGLHQVWIRPRTSDLFTYYQIYVEDEYRCLTDIEDPKLLIDCGANVGYATAYFLSRFPNATAIAVEPDSENFELLLRNTKAFGDRVSAVRAGIWPRDAGLIVRQPEVMPFGKHENAFVVLECKEGETPDVRGVNIESLLRDSGYETIDILKIDIEGAEKPIFSENYQGWLSRTSTIVIEVHGDECGRAVEAAVASREHTTTWSGELTVYRFENSGQRQNAT